MLLRGPACLRARVVVDNNIPFICSYGGHRFVEPPAPRTELSYLEVRFRENKLEEERLKAQAERRKQQAKKRAASESQVGR